MFEQWIINYPLFFCFFVDAYLVIKIFCGFFDLSCNPTYLLDTVGILYYALVGYCGSLTL